MRRWKDHTRLAKEEVAWASRNARILTCFTRRWQNSCTLRLIRNWREYAVQMNSARRTVQRMINIATRQPLIKGWKLWCEGLAHEEAVMFHFKNVMQVCCVT